MESRLPLIVKAMSGRRDLAAWARANEVEWRRSLATRGALLFRGFDAGERELSRFVEATSSRWADYREPSTPRRALGDHLYTSTEYPAEKHIALHNENSHCRSWPLKLYFHCLHPAETGGQTPIADCRRVLARLAPATVAEFDARKVLYVRHFSGVLGFRWQVVFGTDRKREVEEFCEREAMAFEWGADDALTVRYVRDAVHRHPLTTEAVWFNHALFFNPVSLDAEVRSLLTDLVSPHQLPYNTFFGDGAAIPGAMLGDIRGAYAACAVRFEWRRGDILLLDNMLVAHGRSSFTGPRRVIVGLADPWSAT